MSSFRDLGGSLALARSREIFPYDGKLWEIRPPALANGLINFSALNRETVLKK